ncbi:hypothetical protein MRS44_016528 [Fusarium solani]|uniref:uncharacterized protein n=1 Tax=Fusarium solani TaxID=169388 RepID=UPI0032C47DB2|nr:hypothetical protein MRS44_016528 [Fusarium solani]
MSHEEGSRGPNPAQDSAGTSKSKPSRGQVWHDILEPPKQDHGRTLVLRPRSKPSTHSHPENRGSQSEEWPASRHPAERDGERILFREGVGPPKENFDVICTPGHLRDATVRLNFRVFHHLDDELEEFNRYVRRGEFGAARSFFDEHLLAHIAYPWVFVQFAEILFEMGDYKSLLQLNPEPVFRLTQFGNRHEDVEAMRRLEINWRLLKASCLCADEEFLSPLGTWIRAIKNGENVKLEDALDT